MLRRAISILLVYAILLQGGTKIGIFAYFQLNKDYIAEVLCINKAQPALECNGKCFLTKQLKSQDEKEKKAPSQTKDVDNTLFYNKDLVTVQPPIFKKKAAVTTDYIQHSDNVYPPVVFHPPLA